MTLETAEKIRNLLNYKENLERELKDYETCTSIDGHINDGCNGLGFRWDKIDRQVRFLIDGTKKEIDDVTKAIESIELKKEC